MKENAVHTQRMWRQALGQWCRAPFAIAGWCRRSHDGRRCDRAIPYGAVEMANMKARWAGGCRCEGTRAVAREMRLPLHHQPGRSGSGRGDPCQPVTSAALSLVAEHTMYALDPQYLDKKTKNVKLCTPVLKQYTSIFSILDLLHQQIALF